MTWSSLGPLEETRIAIGWNDRLRCIAADLAVLSATAGGGAIGRFHPSTYLPVVALALRKTDRYARLGSSRRVMIVVLIQLMLPKPAEQTS